MRFALIIILILTTYSSLFTQNKVTKIKEHNNIDVYSFTKNDGKAFKVEFHIENDIETVERLLLSPAFYKKTINNVIALKEIKKINDTIRYYWIVIGVKNIFKRSGILKVILEHSKKQGEIFIHMEIINEEIQNKQYKPLGNNKIKWILTSKDDERTAAELVFTRRAKNFSNFILKTLDFILVNKLIVIAKNVREEMAQNGVAH